MAYTENGVSGVLTLPTAQGYRYSGGANPIAANKVTPNVHYTEMYDPILLKSRVTITIDFDVAVGGVGFFSTTMYVGNTEGAGLFIDGALVQAMSTNSGNAKINYTGGAGTFGLVVDNTSYSYTFEVDHNQRTGAASFVIDLKSIAGNGTNGTYTQYWLATSLGETTVNLTTINVGTMNVSNGQTYDRYMIYVSDGENWNKYRAYMSNGEEWEAMC